MPAAVMSVVMNIALAALFAASYATLAALHPSQPAPKWFAASYGLGMLTPLAQLGLASGHWTSFFAATVFLSFAMALTLMVAAVSVFYRRTVPWATVLGLVIVSLVAGFILSQRERNTLFYAFVYQTPFLLSMLACMWVVLRFSPRRINDIVLAALFGLTALHFPIKAALAASLGTGVNPTYYINTPYALLSQVSTGILLVATGLALLINAVLVVLRETQIAAETDVLSGVLNRRGFEEQVARVLAEDRRKGWTAALLLIDIDHFKRVNDTFGHAGGDRAIRWFAGMLEHTMPQSAVIGRLGGEEFAILLDRSTRETARLQAEAIREATLSHGETGVAPMTVSIGVTEVRAGEPLHSVQERADAALYAAKHGGRNMVCLSPEETGSMQADNVVALRRQGEA